MVAIKKILLCFCILSGGLITGGVVHAAVLSVQIDSQEIEVGQTISANIFLNTQENIINAIDVVLRFPADRLQVVSPSTGPSIIGIWTNQPIYDNIRGIVRFQGGIPKGINDTKALISRLTFRARSVGDAQIQFGDESQVLLADGKGTRDTLFKEVASLAISLPPPQGPLVTSSTHPDQSYWYNNSDVMFEWTPRGGRADAFSFVLDDNPYTIPDNISDGHNNSIRYRDLGDGIYYFHIKALLEGKWGGVTHFATRIDTTPPASFPITINPSSRTTSQSPVALFETTDTYSGVGYYEIKVVPLNPENEAKPTPSTLFIEGTSPHIISNLNIGEYDIIVKAYDNAGNVRVETKRMAIVAGLFKFITDEGLEIRGFGIIPWFWAWVCIVISLVTLVIIAILVDRKHQLNHKNLVKKTIPDPIKNQLKELKEYRKKYGKIIVIALLLGMPFFSGVSVSALSLDPPQISIISREISNREIFYIGGTVDNPKVLVAIYLQKEETGETREFTIHPEQSGQWFYRHDSLLPAGNYVLWAQSRLDEEQSPPSAQKELTVKPVAIQLGVSRISKEGLFALGLGIFIAISLGLLAFIIERSIRGRKKKERLRKEIKDVEESVMRGFAVLHRDIRAELAEIRGAKNRNEVEKREEEILEDLEKIKKYIVKEVWDADEEAR